MSRGTIGVLAALAALAVAAPAQAASGTWERAWGENVDSVAPGTGFEICIVASQCQGTNPAVGALGGEMNNPNGVAADPAGNVYVADTDNQRIEKFDSSGHFLLAWGRDVVSGNIPTGFEHCLAGVDICKAGVAGSAAGEMSGPAGVAADAFGHVFVADSGNNRIQEFTSDGNFIRMWGKDVVATGTENTGTGFEICHVSACQAGLSSTALIGEMSFPIAVATDAADDVYVTDFSNERIQKFDEEGVPIRAWGKDVVSAGPDSNGTGFEICRAGIDTCKTGTIGALQGELFFPRGIAVDGSGRVYVVDPNNNRVQRFASSGGFQLMWGKDVINGGGTGFEVCRDEIDTCQAGDGTGHLGGELNNPAGVATDSAGNVYVSEEDNVRVQKYGSDGTFQRLWGEDVDSVAPGTSLEVCTVAANCRAGAFLAPFRGGEFGAPDAIAADAAGDVYVADRFNNRVDKFADLPPSVTPPAVPAAPSTPKKKCKKKKRRAAAAKKCKKRKR